jgi:hypothetical protein
MSARTNSALAWKYCALRDFLRQTWISGVFGLLKALRKLR